MKKRNNFWGIFLTILLLGGVAVTAYGSSGFTKWAVDDWKEAFDFIPLPPISSSEEEPPISSEETPQGEEILDLRSYHNHPFYAVNDTAVLTLTITPSSAADKTIVWTSSDASKVSVTPLTGTTARIKCETNFFGTVTITATATQGTAYTGDDVTATCNVTYNHPVEAIDLQLWNYGATPAHTGNATLVSNYTDITDFANYYAFEVVLTPSLPSQPGYTYSHSGVLNIQDYTTLTNISQLSTGQAFKFDTVTPPDQSLKIKVLSEDGIHEDEIIITIGQHLGVAGRQITGSIEVWSNDRATMLNSYASFSDLIVAVQTQGKSWLVGVYIYIKINGMSFVQPNYDILYNSSYFAYTAAGSVNMTNYATGQARVTNPANNATLVLYASAATGGTTNVTIDPQYYTSTFLNQSLPFALSEPVTGLSLDQDTYVF